MKGKQKTIPARILTKRRSILPVCPSSRIPFPSWCTDRAVRATRAQLACFMRGSPFLHSLTERVDYSLQAHGNCPKDPLVRMSLAVASLPRTMQRQADNRHHMIAQVVFVRDVMILSTTSGTIIPLRGLVSNDSLLTARLFEIHFVRPTPWSEFPSPSLESPQLLGYSTCCNSSRESTAPAYIVNHTPFSVLHIQTCGAPSSVSTKKTETDCKGRDIRRRPTF